MIADRVPGACHAQRIGVQLRARRGAAAGRAEWQTSAAKSCWAAADDLAELEILPYPVPFVGQSSIVLVECFVI